MEHTFVTTKIEGRAAYLTLNRPEVLNAINLEMMRSLEDSVPAFSAGTDLSVLVLRKGWKGILRRGGSQAHAFIVHKPRHDRCSIM